MKWFEFIISCQGVILQKYSYDTWDCNKERSEVLTHLLKESIDIAKIRFNTTAVEVSWRYID